MNFNEYLERELQNYMEVITEKELLNLKKYYETYLVKMQIERNILLNGMNSRADIDYSTSFEKAAIERMEAKNNLDNELNKIKNRLKTQEEYKMSKC